ncbi:MAG: hypothetical protein ACR2QT_00770 [Woeseiaceae bacterium]
MRLVFLFKQGVTVSVVNCTRKSIVILVASAILGACSGSQVATTQELSAAADAPYENVLVIFLADSFDSRRYLETEVVKKLQENGTNAVRSTSMMDTRTPVTRETFLTMVEGINADAVLVTQLAALESSGTVVNMNPQATYNFRPTYYYNVWSVDLQEYREPQAMEFEHKLSLATQLFSANSKDVVWAMESKSDIRQKFDDGRDYSIYVDEAAAIVRNLKRGGLIAD